MTTMRPRLYTWMKRGSRVARRFVRRTPAEQWSLVEATAAVVTAWVALRVVSFRRLAGPEQVHDAGAPLPACLRTVEQRVCRNVMAVSRRLFPDRPCLVQALAARWLLARRGIAADLHIGVLKNDGALEAHAWLERSGRVLVGGAASPAVFHPLFGPRASSAESASPSHEPPVPLR